MAATMVFWHASLRPTNDNIPTTINKHTRTNAYVLTKCPTKRAFGNMNEWKKFFFIFTCNSIRIEKKRSVQVHTKCVCKYAPSCHFATAVCLAWHQFTILECGRLRNSHSFLWKKRPRTCRRLRPRHFLFSFAQTHSSLNDWSKFDHWIGSGLTAL